MNKIFKFDFLTAFILLFSLTSYVIFSILKIDILTNTGKYAITLLFLTVFLLLLSRKSINKKDILFLLPFILFIVLSIINIQSFNFNSIFKILLQSSYILLMFTLYKVKIEASQLLMFYFFSVVVYLVLVVSLATTSIKPDSINPNSIGIYTYLIIFIPLLYTINFTKKLPKLKFFLLMVFMIILVLFSGSRSVLLVVIFSAITYVLWNIIIKNKVTFYTYFLFIISIIFSVSVLYPKIYLLENFERYNMLTFEYTGKPLYTGRNIIWENLLEVIKLKPFLGYGTNANARDFITSELSAHNLYLQITLQVGLVGVLFLLIFLFLIWKSLWKYQKNPSAQLTGSFFVGILLYQIFEMSLTQGNFGIGILQWVIIGLGLNYANQQNKPLKIKTL